jgi:hypothetical protein
MNLFREPSELSSHPVDVGRRSEAAIAGELMRRGYDVYAPMNVNSRADFIVDVGGRLVKIQAKTGRLRNGAIQFSTASVRANSHSVLRRSYDGEVDYFAVYCPATDRVYLVPIEECAKGMGHLRVDPPRNAQARRIRWARDYELPPLAA